MYHSRIANVKVGWSVGPAILPRGFADISMPRRPEEAIWAAASTVACEISAKAGPGAALGWEWWIFRAHRSVSTARDQGWRHARTEISVKPGPGMRRGRRARAFADIPAPPWPEGGAWAGASVDSCEVSVEPGPGAALGGEWWIFRALQERQQTDAPGDAWPPERPMARPWTPEQTDAPAVAGASSTLPVSARPSAVPRSGAIRDHQRARHGINGIIAAVAAVAAAISAVPRR